MMKMIWWMFVPFKWTSSQYPFPLKVAGKFPFTPTYKYNVASLPVPICLPTYYNSSEIRKCSTSKFIGSWLLGERGLFGTSAGITFFSLYFWKVETDSRRQPLPRSKLNIKVLERRKSRRFFQCNIGCWRVGRQTSNFLVGYWLPKKSRKKC